MTKLTLLLKKILGIKEKHIGQPPAPDLLNLFKWLGIFILIYFYCLAIGLWVSRINLAVGGWIALGGMIVCEIIGVILLLRMVIRDCYYETVYVISKFRKKRSTMKSKLE